MIGREWKPGDVAMIAGADPAAEGVRAIWQGNQWATSTSRYYNHWQVNIRRELVVIDYEEREQVEHLARCIWDHCLMTKGGPSIAEIAGVAAALREFAKPTPPPLTEMPTDLAARVIDRDNDVWARSHDRTWGCITSQSHPQDWTDLVNVCGPLRIAGEVTP